MALTESDIRLIERAIQGSLGQSEQETFDTRILDPDFETELKLYREIQKAAVVMGRQKMLETFSRWDEEDENSGYAQNKSKSIFWRWAAAIMLLVGTSVILFYRTNHTPENLFSAYYKPFPNLVDPIEKGGTNGPLSISQSYELGDFAIAGNQLTTDSLQQFYQALANMELKSMKKAIPIFREIAVDINHRFHDEAQWMLALSFLHDSQIEECQELLKEIITENQHDFYRQAVELNQQLNEIGK